MGISVCTRTTTSLTLLLLSIWGCEQRIDRFQLVTRHNIRHSRVDPLSSLSLGNGKFAFTADITGLQTFPGFYEPGIPLGTMADWGWHAFPNPDGYTLADTVRTYQVGDRQIPYLFQFSHDPDNRKNQAARWLRENPHRLHLGLVGLEIEKRDGTPLALEEIQHPLQELNLWTGELSSAFEVDGIPVRVHTVCHQEQDRIAFRIESELLRTGRMRVKLSFGGARHEKFSHGYDLRNPGRHSTEIVDEGPGFVWLRRRLDESEYSTHLVWAGPARVVNEAPHVYLLQPVGGKNVFEASVAFAPTRPSAPSPSFSDTRVSSRKGWRRFWESGGAVDFSRCTDPRAFELERRVVLSQYLTKLQCTGSYPPAETGLTYNSWYGKFHLEMHWWHAMHFLLWQRSELVEQQLDYYFRIFDAARATAASQGYEGVRWPKMTGPAGRESPSTIGTFLIWQQPHVIFFADLLYRLEGERRAVLDRYSKLVFATADFMASYARYDETRDEFVLGPALVPAQERFDPEDTINPSFELAYWHWGLTTAQQWRTRLGLAPVPAWQRVLSKLAPLPVKNDRYLFTENIEDSYRDPMLLTDHPMVLGALGFLPQTEVVDPQIMANSLAAIRDSWRLDTCWGWDFPLAALTATALKQPRAAIDLLLMDTPKNTYLINGHNYQDESLRLYLPGNGGLLTAVAELCAVRSDDGRNGFPADGGWAVDCENIHGLH